MSYEAGNTGIAGDGDEVPKLRLLDEVRRRLRVKHYSLRTETVYVGWIRRFILANGKRHPREMGVLEVEQFLSRLAVEGQVAASTQNQALSALLFLYREVLAIELPWMEGVVRAKRPRRLPTVLSRGEIQALLTQLDGRPWLLASLLYGTGMRLMECLRLRVKDVDFARNEITVRDGKGGKDRRTVLPKSLLDPCSARSSARRRCMRITCWRASERYGCRMRWRAVIQTPRAISVGSMCSRRRSVRSIRVTGSSAGITSMTACCRVR